MTTEFKKKIFDIQSEVGVITKDSTNPFYKSKYFDINKLIDQLLPIFKKHNVCLIQPIKDNKVYSIIFDVDTDSEISSCIELSGNKDPQKSGIEITYFRRYTLASLLALQAEDTDGNMPQEKTSKTDKKWLNHNTKDWDNAVTKKVPLEDVKKYYNISKENETLYLSSIL